jgi:hypothetical protein
VAEEHEVRTIEGTTLIVGPGRPCRYPEGCLSASELASRYGASEPLLRWADELRRQGKSPFVERDRAADTGTAVHAALVAHMQGEEWAGWALDDAPDPLAAQCAYDAGVRWLSREKADGWEPESAEIPLVSERLRLAGTYDLILRRSNGRRKLVDIKTRSPLTSGGNARETMLVDSHIIQIGCYLLLLDARALHDAWAASVVYLPRMAGYEASEAPVDVWLARTAAKSFLSVAHAIDAEAKRIRAWGRPVGAMEPVDVAELEAEMEGESWMSTREM